MRELILLAAIALFVGLALSYLSDPQRSERNRARRIDVKGDPL